MVGGDRGVGGDSVNVFPEQDVVERLLGRRLNEFEVDVMNRLLAAGRSEEMIAAVLEKAAIDSDERELSDDELPVFRYEARSDGGVVPIPPVAPSAAVGGVGAVDAERGDEG